jgi:hypothetical protein
MRGLSRAVPLAAVTCLAIGGSGLWYGVSHASGPRSPHDRQHLAGAILDHWARSPWTGAVLRALQETADRPIHNDSDATNFGRIGKASGGTSGPARGFTNVRVNDPSLDTHATDQTTQSETSIAVAGSNVVVGYNDSQQALLAFTDGLDFSGYSYSTDAGATFTDGGTLPNPGNFVNFGDPWLASDRAGNVYYSTLTYGGNVGNLEVAVAKSADGGKTFGTPVFASPHDDSLFYFGDKDALTVGPSPTNSKADVLYDTWDDFNCGAVTCGNGLPVARSTDGGQTWSRSYADQLVQDPNSTSCSFAQYIGAQPLVDPRNGTLYIAAEKFSVTDPDCTYDQPFVSSEVVFRSTDGGQSFSTGVTIATVTSATPLGALDLGNGQFIRTVEFPTLALSNGTLYAAWNDGASGNSHIRLAASGDDGQTWSLSWASQGSNDELQPALTADKAGLHLLYYQRNSDNTLDVVLASSRNGSGWTTARVTSTSFPGVVTVPQFDPQIAFGYMGDYIANVSDGTHSYFAWGDNRDIVTDYTHPRGRHDPDVFFAKQ